LLAFSIHLTNARICVFIDDIPFNYGYIASKVLFCGTMSIHRESYNCAVLI
jgi:hypothetical protein